MNRNSEINSIFVRFLNNYWSYFGLFSRARSLVSIVVMAMAGVFDFCIK